MADEVVIEPLLDRNINRISPAIDLVDGKAAIGVWIPCSVTRRKGDNFIQSFTHFPYYILEDKQLLPIDEKLFERGYGLASEPIPLESRWEIKHIQDFLKNGGVPNPIDVFEAVLNAWQEYIEFTDEREYLFHAIWDIGTYFHHLFNAYPYDYIGGVKQTGKTKALMLHSCIAFNAVFSGNMSTASIYRLIQTGRCTLLMDETEKLSEPDRALDFRNMLLFGYKKGGFVYRCDKGIKERIVPERFEVYSPKAIANIRGIEDVLLDRCKVTILQRAKDKEIARREIDTNDPRWAELRDRLFRLYLGYWRQVKQEYDALSERSELMNVLGEVRGFREVELWRPVLAVANFIYMNYACEGNEHNEYSKLYPSTTKFIHSLRSLEDAIVGLAQDSIRLKKVEDVTETAECILLKALSKLVDKDEYYQVKAIREGMRAYYDEPQDKWLTTRWVGSALRRLGFGDKRRRGTGYEYKLTIKDIKDVVTRLGLLDEVIAEQKEQTKGGQAGICDICGMPAIGTFYGKRLCEKCARDFKEDL